MTSIALDVRQRLGDFRLDARFHSDGPLTVLFGRSGSGKTSLVNLVAGLARPDAGRIAVGDTVLADTETRIFVPGHKRRIGYVFQDARLFPHMSVRANLRYGGWFAARESTAGDFERIVALLGIAHLLRRRPAGLSGGERQRVAIGRALLSNPRLLLLDEPLAALDEARKAEILPYIERLRDDARIPILYVSHSVAEVLRLASTLVVLDGGRVVAQGQAADVMRQLDLLPSGTDAEAGCHLDTSVENHDVDYGLTALRFSGARLLVPRIDARIGDPVRLRVRARDVVLSTGKPEGLSALNAFPATITRTRRDGEAGLEVALDLAGQRLLARVTRRSFDAMGLRTGGTVYAVLKAVSFDRRHTGGDVTHLSGAAVEI